MIKIEIKETGTFVEYKEATGHACGSWTALLPWGKKDLFLKSELR